MWAPDSWPEDFPVFEQFHLGGSSAVPEETPGLSRTWSKAGFQGLLSSLIPQGIAVGQRSELLIMAGAGGVCLRPGRGKGWGRAVEVSLRNKPKVYLLLLLLISIL